ncbi:hypothetical protein AMTRI_Chr11g153550 [Amborella trichopoda]
MPRAIYPSPTPPAYHLPERRVLLISFHRHMQLESMVVCDNQPIALSDNSVSCTQLHGLPLPQLHVSTSRTPQPHTATSLPLFPPPPQSSQVCYSLTSIPSNFAKPRPPLSQQPATPSPTLPSTPLLAPVRHLFFRPCAPPLLCPIHHHLCTPTSCHHLSSANHASIRLFFASSCSYDHHSATLSPPLSTSAASLDFSYSHFQPLFLSKYRGPQLLPFRHCNPTTLPPPLCWSSLSSHFSASLMPLCDSLTCNSLPHISAYLFHPFPSSLLSRICHQFPSSFLFSQPPVAQPLSSYFLPPLNATSRPPLLNLPLSALCSL